jgi:hypothetical protein
VIAQQGDGPMPAREIDDLAAVGAAVHQIAEQNEPVALFQMQTVEQFGEFLMTTVDVTDGDKSSVHAHSQEIG